MYIISSSSENSYRKMNNHRHTIYTNIYIYICTYLRIKKTSIKYKLYASLNYEKIISNFTTNFKTKLEK